MSNKEKLLNIGDRCLFDPFWTYTHNGKPNPTVPGVVLDVTNTQYYISPDNGSGAQYVWHSNAIKEPEKK